MLCVWPTAKLLFTIKQSIIIPKSLPSWGWEGVWRWGEVGQSLLLAAMLCQKVDFAVSKHVKMQHVEGFTGYRGWMNKYTIHTHNSYLHSFSLLPCCSSWITSTALVIWLWNEATPSNWGLCAPFGGQNRPLLAAGCRWEEWKIQQLSLTCLTMHKGADIPWCP